uniref:Chemokine interleukin-8-like domain-containing protein n=1 Tax=Oryzias latipes TaxID=8090 RepID=A0A3P9JX54_ORYLA
LRFHSVHYFLALTVLLLSAGSIPDQGVRLCVFSCVGPYEQIKVCVKTPSLCCLRKSVIWLKEVYG